MSNIKNLINQRFGRLTVIERTENKGKHAAWKCACDCGNVCVVSSQGLLHGTKSCGCLRKEISTKHGISNKKLYGTWYNIVRRCTNPNDSAYSNYGARGITIYEKWKNNPQSFIDYVSTLEHFGEKGYTLDRIDNNGNYEPNNLRWADPKTQVRNRRNTTLVEYNGEKIPLAAVAEKLHISYTTLKSRLTAGTDLFRPVHRGYHNE